MIWWAVLAGSIGCYLVKLAGLAVPARVLADPRIERLATLPPIALLTALIMVQTFAAGDRLVLDARAAGLGAGVVAILLRAPFLVVIALAAGTAALVRTL